MRLQEVISILNVTNVTVYNYVNQGRIRVKRIGRRYEYDDDDVNRILSERKSRTKYEDYLLQRNKNNYLRRKNSDAPLFNVIKKLQNIEDVKRFFKFLFVDEHLCFHPDDDFCDYINFENNDAVYTKRQALIRNKRMTEAFEICSAVSEDCIYELASEIMINNVA